MALPLFPFAPDQTGYALVDADNAIAVELDGGAPRVRADVLGGVSTVSVRWSLRATEYQAFRSFYATAIARGALPFALDLIHDQPFLTRHTARIQPGSLKVDASRVNGGIYTVTATLWVSPGVYTGADLSGGLAAPSDAALAIVSAAYGAAAADALLRLAQAVNADLPAAAVSLLPAGPSYSLLVGSRAVLCGADRITIGAPE